MRLSFKCESLYLINSLSDTLVLCIGELSTITSIAKYSSSLLGGATLPTCHGF
jgi:hypothetical protein